MQTYIAMNMNDFHMNQKEGVAGTSVELVFISAESIDKAKAYIRHSRPERAWGVIPKSTIDKNLV